MIIGFGLFMLIIGRYVINKTLPWIQQKLSWPGGVLSISLGLCFLGAAFTQYIGLHAILGAFIVGIAFGDSVHLQDREREIIYQFVTNIFAPLFFILPRYQILTFFLLKMPPLLHTVQVFEILKKQ